MEKKKATPSGVTIIEARQKAMRRQKTSLTAFGLGVSGHLNFSLALFRQHCILHLTSCGYCLLLAEAFDYYHLTGRSLSELIILWGQLGLGSLAGRQISEDRPD